MTSPSTDSIKHAGDIVFAVFIAVVSGTLFAASLSIPLQSDTPIDSRGVPMVLSGVVALVAALYAVLAVKRDGLPSVKLADFNSAETRIVLCLACCMAAYRYFFEWFGFFTATILVLIAAFALFSERRFVLLALLPIIGAVVAQILFFQLMGVFEPGGSVFDLLGILGLR